MNPNPKDIEVEMTFLTTEEGGRKNPVWSGYRPQFHYDGQDWDAAHEYIEVQSVRPGDTIKAYLRFFNPQNHSGKLHVGQKFLIREGSRTVAQGHITQILELEESARRAREERKARGEE